MKRNMVFMYVLLLVMMLLAPFSVHAQSSNPQQTLNQYLADLQKNPNDYALREKIIKHVQAMRPAPAVPKEAERFMTRGAVAMKSAKDVNDFKDSVTEFEKATLAAPWLANAYYNLGVAQEKAGLYDAAIKSLKLYLLAAPNASDANSVEKRIYEIEYRQEKAAKESSPQAIAEKKRLTEEEVIKRIDGSRYVYQSRDEDLGAGGDTTIDVQGNVAIMGLIMTWTRDGNPIQGYPFGVWKKIRSDGYVRGRQIIIPEQSWSGSVNNSTWFPRDPLVCAISEDGNTLTCKRTAQTGSQETNVYQRQR